MARFVPALVVAVLCGCGCAPDGAADPDPAPDARPGPTAEELVADAGLRFVLTAEEMGDTCAFYGTTGRREVALLGAWPDYDYPALAGYTVHRGEHKDLTGPDRPKVLGIRLERLDLTYRPTQPFFDSGVELSVENAGGYKNGRPLGGCSVYLTPRQAGGQWVVEFAGLRD